MVLETSKEVLNLMMFYDNGIDVFPSELVSFSLFSCLL